MMLVSGSVAGFWVCPSSRTSPASAARHLLTLPTPLSRVGSSLLHRLHPDVLLGVRELLLRQKAQGGPRGPRAAVWEVPRFPSESEDVESGAEVG